MAPPQEGACATCQTPTHKNCSRCQLDSAPLTFYCSKECQTADYKNHKRICLARQQLFRGAKILKEAFLEFREKGFDLDIYDIKKVGDELHFSTATQSSDAGPLYTFPSHLISDQSDKEALLTYGACNDVLRYLSPLVERVLQDITSTTTTPDEIAFAMPRPHLKVHRHSDDSTEEGDVLLHQVLEVTLRNGERYVIDLAGAQQRQYQPIVPWKAYVARMSPLYTQSQQALGFEAGQDVDAEIVRLSRQRTSARLCRGILDKRIDVVDGQLAKTFYNLGVNAWQKSYQKTVTEMLRGTNSDFEADMKTFLSSTKVAFETQIEVLKEDGGPKYTSSTPEG